MEVINLARDVKCEVNSCRYWAAGNECHATSIYVVNRMNTKQASHSEETDCQTFESKI
jgi:hypothetical protein